MLPSFICHFAEERLWFILKVIIYYKGITTGMLIWALRRFNAAHNAVLIIKIIYCIVACLLSITTALNLHINEEKLGELLFVCFFPSHFYIGYTDLWQLLIYYGYNRSVKCLPLRASPPESVQCRSEIKTSRWLSATFLTKS